MLSILPFTCTYCINVIRLTIYTYIMYKCYPNKTVFFIVFSVTGLLQGQFKVETTTSFQRWINVETTTLSQRWNHNVSTTFKYNHISTLMCDCCINVDTALLCLLGTVISIKLLYQTDPHLNLKVVLLTWYMRGLRFAYTCMMKYGRSMNACVWIYELLQVYPHSRTLYCDIIHTSLPCNEDHSR